MSTAFFSASLLICSHFLCYALKSYKPIVHFHWNILPYCPSAGRFLSNVLNSFDTHLKKAPSCHIIKEKFIIKYLSPLMCICVKRKYWLHIKISMGRIDVNLPDHLERAFREEVFRRKGFKKGNISESIKEAITLWMKSNDKTIQPAKSSSRDVF
jgi:hypothetical protein